MKKEEEEEKKNENCPVLLYGGNVATRLMLSAMNSIEFPSFATQVTFSYNLFITLLTLPRNMEIPRANLF